MSYGIFWSPIIVRIITRPFQMEEAEMEARGPRGRNEGWRDRL
jgi:hypothetical protein